MTPPLLFIALIIIASYSTLNTKIRENVMRRKRRRRREITGTSCGAPWLVGGPSASGLVEVSASGDSTPDRHNYYSLSLCDQVRVHAGYRG